MKFGRLLLAASLLGAASDARTDTGVLTGRVLSTQKLPVASTTVLVERDGKKVMTGVTDASGSFRFPLPAGTYELATGKTHTSVSVTGQQTTNIDLILTLDTEPPQFFDEPQFTVAGVTDNTYRGGHGSDSVLRSSETLTKATASLSSDRQTTGTGEPHHARAEQEERSGHSLEAVREFQKAAELDPNERNLFDWGTELLSHRAPKAAADVFAKGNRLFPHSVRMLLGLATSWYADGAFDRAAQCFFEAIDNNPDDSQPYSFLNQAQSQEITQTPGYHERFARYVRLHPENALANYYCAVSLWQQRQSGGDSAVFEQVRMFLTRALALDSHLASAFVQLGILDVAQVRYAEAIDAFQKALIENPDLEEAHYRLSKAYRLSGNPAAAEQELATYQALSRRSSENIERERREVRQFVIALKKTSH